MSAKDRIVPDANTLTITWPDGTPLDGVSRETSLSEAQIVTMFYSPSQPRADDGTWTKVGGGGGARASRRDPEKLRARIANAKDPNSPKVDPIRTQLYRALSADGATSPATLGSIAKDLSVPDGGFTYDPRTKATARAGFAVSPYPELSREIDVKGKSPAEVRTEVMKYMADNKATLDEPGHWAGGWHDPDTGKAWLDVSILVGTAQKARRVGLEKDQLAYFDMGTMSSVVVDRNATSGQGVSG